MPVYRIQFNRPTETKRLTPDPDALRVTGPCVPVVIEVPSALARRFQREDRLIPDPISGYAMFDTGASITSVDRRVFERLQLFPVGRTAVTTAAGQQLQSKYPGRLSFPGTPLPERDFAELLGADLSGLQSDTGKSILALLGRDLLMDMILIYDGRHATVTITY
jgi:hypothetical protein